MKTARVSRAVKVQASLHETRTCPDYALCFESLEFAIVDSEFALKHFAIVLA